ncbi:MAG TPA: hypothetical protein VMV05_11200 [bacterium]|nr:hypothetical protein [bacterium]
MKLQHFQIGLILIILAMPGITRSNETAPFSGKASFEEGGFQYPGTGVISYQYSRLLIEGQPDLLQDFSLGFAGEARWQASGSPVQPGWPLFPLENAVKLETDNLSTYDGGDLYSLRLSRAFLHFTTGRMEVTAGLAKPAWGSSFFYSPTDYFFPLNPLAWERDQPLGSEGADAMLFLFDDLSLEGATRWLQGGQEEGVVRLVDKGIGITVTPSLAWMNGRSGAGLELVGTFPTLQVRVEGVDWIYPDGHALANWTIGLSTSHEDVKYTAEVLRDGTGEILGAYSTEASQATYVFISTEGSFFGKWRAAPALVAPLEGGPILFWPRVEYQLEAGWVVGFQAQCLLGNWSGPLALAPGRCGLSLEYTF